MIRIAVAAAVLASPALAHQSEAPHLHETDSLSLVMGLVLIAAGLGAGVYVKVRNR